MTSMVGSMEQMPSDLAGTWICSEMGVYGGWVALEESFAADQPFFNEQRDIALIFAGECFFDPQIQTELTRKGHGVVGNRDSWLIHLYEEEGDRFFERLNGLFSGLLVDKKRRKAFLFNDRFGVRRIYCHETKDAIYFASEAKALLRVVPELRAFDDEGIAQFLTFGCTLDGHTLFRGIQVIPGGSLWMFEGGKCRKGRYFSPSNWESQPILSAESFEAEFQETFKSILPRYFESESKIGISLTAGLDSRMIMASMPIIAETPVCYTFSGEEQDTLDARLAARVAEACGLQHHILRISQDFFSDFASHADHTVYATDGSMGILGAHEIYLNAQARQLARVRLTGNYGSEILRGATTFKPLGLSPQLMGPDLRKAIGSCVSSLARERYHPVTFAAFREIPEKRFGILAASCIRSVFRTPYLDNQIVALAYQAPKNILMSPLPALRFVTHNNPALATIPTDMGLVGLSRGVRCSGSALFSRATFKLDYYYNEGLPHWLSRLDPLLRHLSSKVGILGLHKFLHYRSWIQRELSAYVNGVLTDAQTLRSPFWNCNFLESMGHEHTSVRMNYVREIDAVLTLEAVDRLLLRGQHAEHKTKAASEILPAGDVPVHRL